MSTNKTATSANNLQSKQTLKAGGNAKHFHQFFTVYLIAVFLVVAVGLSSILFFLAQQYKHSQTLITEQLVPLQTQFLQQSYLINTNKLINGILQNANAHEFITLQQALSLQSKKLSLLKSEHKSRYQQWFSSNTIAMNLLTRIESSHADNELLKSKSLIQLDTLLDAIKIQLNTQQTASTQAALLSKVENQLTNIVAILKRLNLKTPLETFEQLSNQINAMFVADYAKQLADQLYANQGMSDIVRDFIRFEDMILKKYLLAKWRNNLRLINNYHQQLVVQQQQLQSIFDEQLASQQEANSASVINDYAVTNKETILINQLPLWVVIIFAFALTSVVGLLWLIRNKIKAASQFNVKCISYAIECEPSSSIAEEIYSFFQLDNQGFYSAETEQLIKKIQQKNINDCRGLGFLALTDKNQILAEEVVKDEAKQEQLKLELELVKFDVSAKFSSQLLLEQQRCEALHLDAIKQLVLLGCSAVTTTRSAINKKGTGEEENYLYHAHLKGRDLVRKLRQASCYRYLQSNDGLLTLSDVNIADQIQVIVFNLRNKLFLCKNRLSVSIDEKILTEVNLDAELFSEMFRVFIRLLFSQQTGKQLALNLQLVDKNNGQQIICFTGQVQGKEKIVQLPHTLQGFNDESAEKSELGDYFNTLLHYQHGDDVSTKLTEQAYQFSFTLPLAVANNQQEKHYPVLSLPGYLADIENVCVKLAAKYLAMPIEVLLAVKTPEKYQHLQQLLQGMGLQVTFVICELMLEKNWQSGRFAVLMTEIDCQPFTAFMVDEGEKSSNRIALTRGVFSLGDMIDITSKSKDYSHWVLGELNAKSAVSELITAMRPWIKEQKCGNFATEKVTQITSSHNNISVIAEDKLALTGLKQAHSFNFERYLKNQGSAELAIFMLEEYTTENIVLVKELSQAFTVNDTKKANTVIQALLVNGRILAAGHLLHLCQHWQALLSIQRLDNSEKLQIFLLNKTKKAVGEINQYAGTVA